MLIKVIDKNIVESMDKFNYLKNTLINQYKDIRLKVSETESDVVIKVTFEYKTKALGEYSLEEKFKKSEYKNSVLEVTLLKNNTLSPYNELLLLRKFCRVQAPISSSDNSRCFWCASMFITDDTIYVVPRIRLTSTSNIFDNSEHIDTSFENLTPQKVLFNFCSEAKAIAEKWHAKKIYLGDIDVNSSISYLENQVDVLYKIIEKIVEKTGVDVSEYKDVLDAVENSSSLKVNTIEKITSKLNRDKALVRHCQEEYYTKRKESSSI